MKAGIFDSHCHYNDRRFKKDKYAVLDRLLVEEGHPVDKMLHASLDEKSALAGIEFAKRYENFYTSIGFHPNYFGRVPDNYMDVLDELYLKASETHKLCAVGETGLDYHYDDYDKEKQTEMFRNQLEFALSKSLPVIIHCRDAWEDCMNVLREYRPEGVMHCFLGSAEMAAEVVDLGMYVSFSGAIAFDENEESRRTCKVVPMDKILVETDCPYLSPPPYRGRRCDSSMIVETAKIIAEIKGISVEDVISITNANACRLFRIE